MMDDFEAKNGFRRDVRILDIMHASEGLWKTMWGGREEFKYSPWPSMCTATCLLLAPILRAGVPDTNFDVEVGCYLDGIQEKNHAWIRFGDWTQSPELDWYCDPTHEQFDDDPAMINDTGGGRYRVMKRLTRAEEQLYRQTAQTTFNAVLGFNTSTKIPVDFWGRKL